MCGDCLPGYSQSVFGASCVNDADCRHAPLFWLGSVASWFAVDLFLVPVPVHTGVRVVLHAYMSVHRYTDTLVHWYIGTSVLRCSGIWVVHTEIRQW
jgi:hypothetical protein